MMRREYGIGMYQVEGKLPQDAAEEGGVEDGGEGTHTCRKS
jgi:hypothetical protein